MKIFLNTLAFILAVDIGAVITFYTFKGIMWLGEEVKREIKK